MKNILVSFLLVVCFCNNSFAQSFYFKKCKLSNAVTGNYIINLDKNLIEVNLKAVDGTTQNFNDKIKLIEKDKIVSEKIKSGKGEKIYYQYFLNSKTQTVIKLQYIKQSGLDIEIFKLNEKRESFCSDVKSGWDTKKIEAQATSKEQKQILEAKEKMKKEKNKLIECQGNDHTKWTNCKGSFKADSGHKYDGIFKNGEILKGTSTYPGAAQYVGEFKNFKPHGYGNFSWENGNKYYGEWRDGKNNGNGTKIWKDGREYSGTFKDDKLHGQGTLYYPDGKKYMVDLLMENVMVRELLHTQMEQLLLVNLLPENSKVWDNVLELMDQAFLVKAKQKHKQKIFRERILAIYHWCQKNGLELASMKKI